MRIVTLRGRHATHRSEYVEIKCQLDTTDDFYCRSYCLLNMFRGTTMPIIRTSRVCTEGCCLWYLEL